MEQNMNKVEESMVSTKPDYTGEIIAIIRSPISPSVMRERLEDYHEKDIAEVLPALTSVERKKLYRILEPDMLSNILERMEGDEAGSYLIEMDLRKAAQVVECMESDSALEILSQLDRDQKGNLIECMDETSQKELALMASFGEDEIGSKMTTNYISIQEDLTVKQAMSALIQQASEMTISLLSSFRIRVVCFAGPLI